MNAQLAISIAVIILSISGFILSAYVAFRDRSRLKTESYVTRHDKTGEYYKFYFKVLNAGRRPVVLTLIEGIYDNIERINDKNHKRDRYIDYKNKGIKLAEGEYYEHSFAKYDWIMVYDPRDNGIFFPLDKGDLFVLKDLFVVDSANRRYRIKNAKKNIQLLWSSKHPVGVR